MGIMDLDLGGKRAREESAEQERQRAAQQEQERQRAAQEKADAEKREAAGQRQKPGRADFSALAKAMKEEVNPDELTTGDVYRVSRAALDSLQSTAKQAAFWRDKARELEKYQREHEAIAEDFKKWRATQKQGKQQKPVDWKRYDELKAARISEKDIAKYLRMSANTLRKRVKERNA